MVGGCVSHIETKNNKAKQTLSGVNSGLKQAKINYSSNCWNFSRLGQNPNFSLHFDHFRMIGLLVPFFSDYAMVYSILYTTPILPTSWCFTTSSPCRSSYWMIKVWEIGWCLGLKFEVWKRKGHFCRGDWWLHFSFLGAGRM